MEDAMTKPARHPLPADDLGAEKIRLDALLDEALEETFPASDPVAIVVAEPEPTLAPTEKGREDDTGRHSTLREAAGSGRSP